MTIVLFLALLAIPLGAAWRIRRNEKHWQDPRVERFRP